MTFYEEPKIKLPEGVRYVIYGYELCPETGRPHWQAYAEFFQSHRPGFCKKAWGINAHCEKRRGTREQARDYCKKDGEWEEHGRWIKGQGHRSDLDTIGEQLVSGEMTLDESMHKTPGLYMRYRKGFQDLAAKGLEKKSKKFRKLNITLITGPTGCGKTRKAMKHCDYKIQGYQLDWWQGYNGEKSILIDEYSNDIKITKMLGLLDGYQLRLNQKGTHTYAMWDTVYITTNLKMDEIHPNASDAHREALFRRINNVVNQWEKQPDENIILSRSGLGNTKG